MDQEEDNQRVVGSVPTENPDDYLEDAASHFMENAEYLPEKFAAYLHQQIQKDYAESQEHNFRVLTIVKNELVGQTNNFRRKLVTNRQYQTVEPLLDFIDNYKLNNPFIIKEVITILNCLFQFLKNSSSPALPRGGISEYKKKCGKYVKKVLQTARYKQTFLRMLEIVSEYADEAVADSRNASVSVFEMLFMFLDTLVEVGCLQPIDFAAFNVFETINKGLQVYPNSQVQMRLQYVASTFITLLSKNSHLVEQDPDCKQAKALETLKLQLRDHTPIVGGFLRQISDYRFNISDHALITTLKALSWSARNDTHISIFILEDDNALDELLDLLRYPHRGIKVQVSSLLATLRQQVTNKPLKKVSASFKKRVQFLKSNQTTQVFQWILIEYMNQSGLRGSYVDKETKLPLGDQASPEFMDDEDSYLLFGNNEHQDELYQFIQICDTIQSILRSFQKKHFQQICLQVDMPQKLWECWGTYREPFVHKAKIFQVFNEIASNSKQAIQAIIQIDGLQKKLYNCIEQKEEKESDKKDAAGTLKKKKKHVVNRQLRYSAIELFGTLGSTKDNLAKMIILDKKRFISMLAGILIQETEGDYPMKILILRAINNFIFQNAKDLIKEAQLIKELQKYIDVVLDYQRGRKELEDKSGKEVPLASDTITDDQQQLAARSLFVIKTSLNQSTFSQKEEIIKQFGWDRLKQCFDVELMVQLGSEGKFNKDDFKRLSVAILQNLLLNSTAECLKNLQIRDIIDKLILKLRESAGFVPAMDGQMSSSVAKETESELFTSSVDPDAFVSKEDEQFTALVTFKKEAASPVRVQKIFLCDIMTIFHMLKCLSIIAGSREWSHKELIVGDQSGEAASKQGSTLDCVERILFSPVCMRCSLTDMSLQPAQAVDIIELKQNVHGLRKEAILLLKNLIQKHRDVAILESKDKASKDAAERKKEEAEKKTESKDDKKEGQTTAGEVKEQEVTSISWLRAQNALTSERYQFLQKLEKIMGVRGKGGKKHAQGAESDSEEDEFDDKDGNSDLHGPMNTIIKDINCAPGSPSGAWWMDREIEKDIKDIIKQFKKH